MFEFLAPWGILAPAISAVAIYIVVNGKRREKMMVMIEAPDDAPMTMSRANAASGLA